MRVGFVWPAVDFVSARNSIDHTYDPLEAIKQMLRCVKENHIVAMDHVENEGKHQHYRGLHQWNLTLERGEFFIRGKGRVINVSSQVLPAAGSRHLGDGPGEKEASRVPAPDG